MTVGPFYVFYPAKKHNHIQKWLQNEASSTLSDPNFVVFEPVQETAGDSRRDILLSVALWRRVAELADKAFVMDQMAVLCGNPTTPLVGFMEWDWIGAAQDWAQDPSLHITRAETVRSRFEIPSI